MNAFCKTPLLPLVLASALASGGVSAQSVIGTTVIDGQQVELLSNNTWRFAATAPLEENCGVIDGPVIFCGPAFRWQRAAAAPGPAIDALFQVDDRNFGMIITEGLGRVDGLSAASLREAVLINAGAAGGVGAAGVPVLEELQHPVGEKSYPTIAYQVTLQGLNFTYLTTMIVGERNSTQLTTYSIAGEVTESHRLLHDEFLSYVRLER